MQSPAEQQTGAHDRAPHRKPAPAPDGSVPPRHRGKAVITVEGDRVTKDYSTRSLRSRLIGRFFLNREQAALKHLEGIVGVPRFIARPGPYTLVMSRVPGTPVYAYRPGELGDDAFPGRLESLVASIHERGVAHGDAHYRNVLYDAGRPGLVDFSTAVIARSGSRRGRLFRWWCQLDLERVYKIERRYYFRGEPPPMFLLYRAVRRLQGRKT